MFNEGRKRLVRVMRSMIDRETRVYLEKERVSEWGRESRLEDERQEMWYEEIVRSDNEVCEGVLVRARVEWCL